MCMGLLPARRPVRHVCAVPEEAKRGCRIPWSWSHTQAAISCRLQTQQSPPPQLLSTWLVSAGDSQAFIFRLPALIPKPPQPILWGARQGNRLTMFSILKEVQITWEVLHVRWNGQAPLQKILLKTDLSRAACGPYALRSNSPELVRQTSCDIHLLNQGHAGFWCR